MLIPIRHEGMQARRWPIITFSLIALNVLCFLFTYPAMERQAPQLGNVKLHILTLAATHPELTLQPETQQFVDDFKQQQPEMWGRLEKTNQNVEAEDGEDAQEQSPDDPAQLQPDDPAQLQQEMDSFSDQYVQLKSSSITEQYAFVPAHPKPISYVTASFLHGGWMHLIGNMWFLWLAGFVLEDVWGRPLYSVFYLI